MNSVLKLFLVYEADLYVRKLILDTVDSRSNNLEMLRKRFEFDRFDVTLDFETNMVLIEDELDSTASGEIQIQLEEFVQMLERSPPPKPMSSWPQ